MRRRFRRLLTAVGRWGFTIMIVPRRGEVRRVVVPWLGVISLVLMFSAIGYFIGYYPYGQYKHSQNVQTITGLQQENDRLEKENQQVKPALERSQEVEGLLNKYEEEITNTKNAYDAVRRKAPAQLSSRSGSYRPAQYRLPDPVVVSSDGTVSLLQSLEANTDSLLTQLNKQLDEATKLKDQLVAYGIQLDHTPSIWPVKGRITSSFGTRIHPITKVKSFHEGVDIAVPTHTPVKTTADGKVTYAGWKSGYGYTVIIDHGYGYDTLYGHNSKLLVKAGQKVKKGQTVSYSGSTGTSTGPHVHYEVWINNRKVNPISFMR